MCNSPLLDLKKSPLLSNCAYRYYFFCPRRIDRNGIWNQHHRKQWSEVLPAAAWTSSSDSCSAVEETLVSSQRRLWQVQMKPQTAHRFKISPIHTCTYPHGPSCFTCSSQPLCTALSRWDARPWHFFFAFQQIKHFCICCLFFLFYWGSTDRLHANHIRWENWLGT